LVLATLGKAEAEHRCHLLESSMIAKGLRIIVAFDIIILEGQLLR